MPTGRDMDERTLTALKGSIAKWEAIVAGTGKDEGWANCPLCREFHFVCRTDGLTGCDGCPVSARTGQWGCVGSPYGDFEEHTYSCADKGCAEHKRLAQAELDFLKGLLPEGDAP